MALLLEDLEKSNLGNKVPYFDFLFGEGSLGSAVSLQSPWCKQPQKQQTVPCFSKKVNNHLMGFSKHLTCGSHILTKKKREKREVIHVLVKNYSITLPLEGFCLLKRTSSFLFQK